MLNKEQIKYLKSLAHALKPVVWVGQHGLSDNLMEEINSALDHHEIVKITIRVGDREVRDSSIEAISTQTSSEVIHKIGNVITLYRQKKKDPVIKLPK